MILYEWLFVALIVLPTDTVSTPNYAIDGVKSTKSNRGAESLEDEVNIETASDTKQPIKLTEIPAKLTEKPTKLTKKPTKLSKKPTKLTKKPMYSHIKGFEEKGYQEGMKPLDFQDYMDKNLKKFIIGVIALISVGIITIVCCCVCCAATVCNPTRKQCNTAVTEAKQEQAEVQDYLQYYYTNTYHPTSPINKIAGHEVPCDTLHYSGLSQPWRSR